MSMVITSKKLLEERHNITKMYQGLHHLLENQESVLAEIKDNVSEEQDDVCLEGYEYNYFNVLTPKEALSILFSNYGKENVLTAIEELTSKTD